VAHRKFKRRQVKRGGGGRAAGDDLAPPHHGKNDTADAAAICDAVQRPGMAWAVLSRGERFVLPA
jgi:hypothetical protein